MKIPRKMAQGIVEGLKGVIKQDLNFMDYKGYIIASTDPTRIDSFHEASLKCVRENKIIVIDKDMEYIGSKKGINLPVVLDDEVVGVIGISGERDEVEEYGNIIKKITEIWLKEEMYSQNKTIKIEYNKSVVDAIINKKIENYTIFPDELIFEKKYLVAFRAPGLGIKEKGKIFEFLLNRISLENFSGIINENIVMIFICNNPSKLKSSLGEIYNYCKNKYSLSLYFGVSNYFIDLSLGTIAYNEAMSCLKERDFGLGKSYITFYQDMNLGIILGQVPEEDLRIYVKKILSNLNEEELELYSKLIYYYGKYNRSIKNVSEALFIHKNTLQYKLDKLEKKTGYDLRKIDDYVILYLAFLIYRNPEIKKQPHL